MKVCLINTADNGGGAPVACRRLLNAFNDKIDVNLMVQDKKTNNPQVISIIKNSTDQLKANINFLKERIPFILFKEKNKAVRFAFSTANSGVDIHLQEAVLKAQILHFHWTNSGFLSIENLKKLFKLDKPMVWTLHDMWPFTGGCHYAGECTRFLENCGNCKFLRNPFTHDISHKGWLKKQDLYQINKKLVLVACSEWMANQARSSSLFKNYRIEAIPNPIDTEIYHSLAQNELKEKWNIRKNRKVILFGAANINDQRKGIKYLLSALAILKKINQDDIEVVIFGKNKMLDLNTLPFPVTALPVISSEKDLVEIYNLADVFVLPSLEDNLPNMVMEALSCGIPVVAFNQGGIPEMVDHQRNGYIANFKSEEDLAKGINWVLNTNTISLKNNARQKILDSYNESDIAKRYIDVYQSIL